MTLTTTLQHSQSQALAITPQFRQALKVLQCSAAELQTLIDQELFVNPLLELDDEELVAPAPERGQDALVAEPGAEDSTSPQAEPLEHIPEGESPYESSGDDRAEFATQQGQQRSLLQSLLQQLGESDATGPQRRAALQIIGNINDDGYLEVDIAQVSLAAQVSTHEAEQALAIVQQFEPAGIGARSLQETLLLQLERVGAHEGLAGTLVRRHLEAVSARRISEIVMIEGVPSAAVQRAIAFIRTLNPFPARGLFEDEQSIAIPEVTITKVAGRYEVLPRGEGSQRLRVSGYYRTLAQSAEALDRESRGYLNARIRGATWFIRCLYQREATIRKIAEVIARTQGHFFDHGFEALRPMVLRDVAQQVSLHESTISRAIADKYVSTPQGVFEFKFFFTPRIKTARGEISTTTIRERLRGFIRNEDPAAPFSDQALAELLARSQVRISRRTVTKYRESLGIPPSALRGLP